MWALGYIKYTKRIVWSVSAHQMMKLKTGSERRRTVVCVYVCVCVFVFVCALQGLQEGFYRRPTGRLQVLQRSWQGFWGG